jgi:hypothetical protein
MTTLYFNRDAAGPGPSTPGVEVSMAAVLEHLQDLHPVFRTGPPRLDEARRLLPGAAHINVVLRVEADEINDQFPKEGYYWFPQLMPWKCRELLALDDATAAPTQNPDRASRHG